MLSTWWLMAREFVPDPNVGAILVSFDPFVSYPKIHKASLYACNPQNIFIATHADERTNCFGHSVPGSLFSSYLFLVTYYINNFESINLKLYKYFTT